MERHHQLDKKINFYFKWIHILNTLDSQFTISLPTHSNMTTIMKVGLMKTYLLISRSRYTFSKDAHNFILITYLQINVTTVCLVL